MQRRTAIFGLAGLAGASLWGTHAFGRSGIVTSEELERIRQDWTAWLPAGYEPDLDLTSVDKSREAWREELSGPAFDVLREEGTERAFTHPYNDLKDEGVFLCAGCELPLFTSAMKFDSGTGWPSFFTAIPDHLETKRDFKLIWPRTEYHCVRCGGHQGHVFDDGPKPTGQRWCNNGVALKFLARAG